jgi:hypothetical protein
MLLTEAQVQAAMKLIPSDIKLAAKHSGYDTQAIYACRFQGLNTASGNFVYEIDYEDTVSGDGTCNVYVKVLRKPMSTQTFYTLEF